MGLWPSNAIHAAFDLSKHVNPIRLWPIRGRVPFASLTWPDLIWPHMTFVWSWPKCNVWRMIWRRISSWIVWWHSNRRPVKTVASRGIWSEPCRPANNWHILTSLWRHRSPKRSTRGVLRSYWRGLSNGVWIVSIRSLDGGGLSQVGAKSPPPPS